MKNGMVMYEKVYRILKNKIECGLIPNGSKLPSRAELCREFDTSEKTVRRVVEMLEYDGLVKTSQRKRPTVTFNYDIMQKKDVLSLRKADATAASDILKTGIFICYPVIEHGISLCTNEEWCTPESILEKMNPDKATGFWRLSNQFWRFFISRNENDLILRAVDSLGLSELDPLPGSFEVRYKYYTQLREFVKTVKMGGDPENVNFDDFSFLYGFLPDQNKCVPTYRVSPNSPFSIGVKGLDRRINRAEERYSRVYLDILGLIAIGRYRPGDRLPSHAELCQTYGVSVDTTVKAIQLLQKWGVVVAIRGKGIFVAMDIESLNEIHIDSNLIAYHIRRYIDSLELLSLTIEGVAAHAASHVSTEEAVKLNDEIENLWNCEYLYQLSPIALLEFLVDHIQYKALKAIYKVVKDNYHIGRSIPKLISKTKNAKNCEIHKQCREAVNELIEGNSNCFAKRTAKMFQYTHNMIIDECKHLNYWAPAMNVYDGSILWK